MNEKQPARYGTRTDGASPAPGDERKEPANGPHPVSRVAVLDAAPAALPASLATKEQRETFFKPDPHLARRDDGI
jgi:hypothetical protein